jgi:hypothetical protein
VNPFTANYCRRCGRPLRKNIMLFLASVGLSWVAWSPFTVNLFAWSNEHVQAPTPTPTPITSLNPTTPPPTPAPTPTPVDLPETEQDIRVDGADERGRHVTFLISLLSDEYRWVMGSSSALEEPHPALIFSDQMRRSINNARGVICVGASSEDTVPGVSEAEGRLLEERRAMLRAETIALWVQRVRSNPLVTIRKLNVGHHRRERGPGALLNDTSDQRRVIIILVLKDEEGADMDEALRNALEQERGKHPIYATILDGYSLTRGPRFTWAE